MADLNDRYIYVFVRQDLSVPKQLVHASHAVYHMANLWHDSEDIGAPNVVVIGVPDIAALNRVVVKLAGNCIGHYVWSDPDDVKGVRTISTEPLTREQKDVLKNYRLYNVRP